MPGENPHGHIERTHQLNTKRPQLTSKPRTFLCDGAVVSTALLLYHFIPSALQQQQRECERVILPCHFVIIDSILMHFILVISL